jgi:hypothetical protein
MSSLFQRLAPDARPPKYNLAVLSTRISTSDLTAKQQIYNERAIILYGISTTTLRRF